MMAIVGYTHTQGPTVAPPTDPYKANDNIVLSPFSAFWGGAITDNVGAFAQVTYSAPDPLSALSGTPADQFKHTWSWDNADVRYASTASIGPLDVVYGITANNNPTVQDLWNTTPAWSFPYAVSTLAGTPGASTMIEGAFAARVGGVGGYTMINDLLYLELTGYQTLGFEPAERARHESVRRARAVRRRGAVLACRARAALGPTYVHGRHVRHAFRRASVARFEASRRERPRRFPQSDKFTDFGFDTQYQYQGDNYWVTLRGSYIREFQRLDASFATFASANPTNMLNSMKLQASFAYGADNRVVLTGQYFDI